MLKQVAEAITTLVIAVAKKANSSLPSALVLF
jgi:hypothetical protein